MNRRTTRTTRSTATAFASAIALVAGLALGGCSSADGSDAAPKLEVSGAFMPEPVNGEMAGGFLSITNLSGVDDTLTSVTSDLSDDVQLHETKDQKMQQVTSFPLPAHDELQLRRGGDHLMFMGLKRTPKQGDKVSIELHFQKSDPIKVELPVEARNHNPQHH